MTVTSALPMRTLLLAFTLALSPMAVALVRLPAETSAPETDGGVVGARGVGGERPAPMAVLSLPVVLLQSAYLPLAVFSCPWCWKERLDAAGGVVHSPWVLALSAPVP